MRRSAQARLFAIVFALLQLLSPAVATWADARLVRESNEAPTGHVESGTTTSCPRAHTAECALCQHIGAVWRLAARVDLPKVDGPVVRVPARPDISAHTGRRFALAFPRAPPAS